MNPGLPRCTQCVLSKNFPKISFDEKGVCNFCRNEMYFTIDKDVIDSAQKTIAELIKTHRGRTSYDAIMCYSGGKDSTYTLMLAVKTYGLKVLAFTLDNGFISPVSFQNMARVVDALGVDHMTFRPSATNLKAIIRASALHQIYNPKTLTRISSVCNSCISIVNVTALKLALEKHAPFIIAGFTLGQIPANSIVYKNNYLFLEESRAQSLEKLRHEAGPFVDDYFCIDKRQLDDGILFPHNLNLLCLEDITEAEILSSIQPFGWTAPEDVDGCSSNCRLNTFNNHVHEKRFGYSPYELELSHLIRKGLMTRDEALLKIKSQPQDQLYSIMNELQISESDLFEK
jgi:hypothetical protein